MATDGYTKTLALMRARILANDPYAAVNDETVTMRLMRNALIPDAITNATRANNAMNITYSTAVGAALLAKAPDYGVSVPDAIPATDMVVFTIPTTSLVNTVIPAGTPVSTQGNGLTSPIVYFITTAPATILGLPSGSPTTSNYASAPTPVQCTLGGALGNVLPGAINQCSLSQSANISVSNATSITTPAGSVANPSGGDHSPSSVNTLGVDAPSIDQTRAAIGTGAAAAGGPAATIQAMLAVTGVYDADIEDPKQGQGFGYWRAVQQDGTMPGLSGGTVTNTGSPDNTTYLAGVSIAGLALQVHTACQNAMSGLIARVGSYSGSGTQVPFQVINVTALTITYSVPAGVQATTVEPLMTAAIQAYINGGTIAGQSTPGLKHNQAPLNAGMYQAAQLATGGVLTNFFLTSGGVPVSQVGTVTSKQIYRCPSLVVTYTKI